MRWAYDRLCWCRVTRPSLRCTWTTAGRCSSRRRRTTSTYVSCSACCSARWTSSMTTCSTGRYWSRTRTRPTRCPTACTTPPSRLLPTDTVRLLMSFIGHSVVSRNAIQSMEHKWVLVQACRLSHLSVGRSVGRSVCLSVCLVGELWKNGWLGWWVGSVKRWVYIYFTAYGEYTLSLDGAGDHPRGRDNFGGEFGASNCNQFGLCGIGILCHEGTSGDMAFSKLLWDFLFICQSVNQT